MPHAVAGRQRNYHLTNIVFNDAYRYMDWILTVPLLLVELVAVLGLPKEESRGLLGKLAFAAFLMIALGYPGEITKDNTPIRALWGFLSTIPFVYIQVVLFKQLSELDLASARRCRPADTRRTPLDFCELGFLPARLHGSDDPQPPLCLTQLGVQVGYTLADIIAKVGLGVFIYFIAMAKTENDARTGSNPFEPRSVQPQSRLERHSFGRSVPPNTQPRPLQGAAFSHRML